MKTLELKNYDEVVDMIAQTMYELDKISANFRTDIYLYIDDDNVGTIDTFQNPGGNSWLDDDHITVYSDGPHYDDFFDVEDGRPWDELTDEEKEEYLPDMSDYEERAVALLDEALEDDPVEDFDFWGNPE